MWFLVKFFLHFKSKIFQFSLHIFLKRIDSIKFLLYMQKWARKEQIFGILLLLLLDLKLSIHSFNLVLSLLLLFFDSKNLIWIIKFFFHCKWLFWNWIYYTNNNNNNNNMNDRQIFSILHKCHWGFFTV